MYNRGFDPYGYDMPPPWFFQSMYSHPPYRGGGRSRGRGRHRRENDELRVIKRWESYQEAKKKREKGKDDGKSPKGWNKVQQIAGDVGRYTLLGIPASVAVFVIYGGILYTAYKVVSVLAK